MKWEKCDMAIHKEKDKNNPYEGHSHMIKKKYAVEHFLAEHEGKRSKIERDALEKRRQK